ncbi:MAG TPA: tRNA preQ1(34) S-adenosylmethionine ribosyltransferase-isomerase QueA [Terriglobales bacterium]|nr:tRNA preQ1(34) S-adenosylmethionine ribosyltransferase-isomerase QueA [Terriglobales bacterium]
MSVTAFDFALPPELIAQHPAAEPTAARLMRVDRQQQGWSHATVAELPSLLRPGDLLVANDTKVIPARLRLRSSGGGSIELLLVRPLPQAGAQIWECLGKPRQRLRPGTRLSIGPGFSARVIAVTEAGRYHVELECERDLSALLAEHGELPLPPYIRRPEGPSREDQLRYQTIYARNPGAIAAPTAGLHFTEELLQRLRAAQVETATVTLHVGPGTFLPIRSDDFRSHEMEAEPYEISAETAAQIAAAKSEGRRVIAIGTTTTRALEAAADENGTVRASRGSASLFIVPGYRFRVIDALFTNFHLPASTLLLLVAAFGGVELMRRAYAEAVARGYRFYSYGDAMLIE